AGQAIQHRPMRKPMKNLQELLAVLEPLVATCQEQRDRRERARTLRQARALRAVPQVRPVARSQAEIALERTPPFGRAVVAAAYDVPIGRPLEELQPSWDDWNRFAYDGVATSFTEQKFAEARNGPLKREVWKHFRNGMTAHEIARTLTYRLEYADPREAPGNPVLFASTEWCQSILDEGNEVVKQRDGIM